MSRKPVTPSVTDRPSMIKEDGLWVHQAVPDRKADWLAVIDQIREERAQATLGLDGANDDPG